MNELKDVTSLVIDAEKSEPHLIDGMQPKVIAYPQTFEELSSILLIASNHRLAVMPLGGGTRSSFGNPLTKLDLLIEMSRFTGIIDHNPNDLTATVLAGTTISSIQDSFLIIIFY